jgi:hypothetical protein
MQAVRLCALQLGDSCPGTRHDTAVLNWIHFQRLKGLQHIKVTSGSERILSGLEAEVQERFLSNIQQSCGLDTPLPTAVCTTSCFEVHCTRSVTKRITDGGPRGQSQSYQAANQLHGVEVP